MKSGFIKDYRKELESPIWLMPPIYHRIWQYLKYTVNHAPAKIPQAGGDFIEIEAGETLTSYRRIGENIAWYEQTRLVQPSPSTIKKVIDWLEKNEMIEVQGRESGKKRKFTIIKIINFNEYQNPKSANSTKTGETHDTTALTESKGENREQTANADNKQTRRIKKNKEEDPEQKARELLKRYNDIERQTIKKYWGVIRQTRKTGKLSNSVIVKNMEKWAKYETDIIIKALQLHMEKYTDKREEYTNGIIRRLDSEGLPQDTNTPRQPETIDMDNIFNE